MIKRITMTIRSLALECMVTTMLLMGIALIILFTTGTSRPSTGTLIALSGVMVAQWVSLWLICRTPGWVEISEKAEGQASPTKTTVRFAPSPWEEQRKLMAISGQGLPMKPTLTKEGLMYGALIMEESGETFVALNKAIEAYFNQAKVNGMDITQFDPMWHLLRASDEFSWVGEQLLQDSARIRAQLASVSLNWSLPDEHAIELFDGTTDIAVVNCGFSLAMGLPGEEGYDEVASSNLSKANPDTGVIDKTPDGKWIKGVNYQKPDLSQVLRNQADMNSIIEASNNGN